MKVAKLDAHTLDQLVEMEAENLELPQPRNAEATPQALRAADKFSRAVSKALSVFAQKYPPARGATVEDLMDAEGAYLVFMTLDEQGVGIWDGSWDRFYKDTSKLERFLRRAVHREYKELKDALVDAAYETAG